MAKRNLQLSQARQKYYADRSRQASPIKAGDYVLLDARIYHFAELERHKLAPKWYGPLLVVSADANTCLLRTPLHRDFHARANVSACRLYHFPAGETPTALPPSQITTEDWEISAIVGERRCPQDRRSIEYRCRLKYPPHNTPEHDQWFLRRGHDCWPLI